MSNEPRRVVVGVSGGIAAYKACHLVRNFKERGDNVRVVPTENALKFVGKATFEALSGNPVSTDVFDAVDKVQHVHVGQTADLIVVAPATADFMARVVAGRGDDLLTSTLLVATCPVVLAPAMHTEMWENPATQANVATLRERGITVLEPAHGRLTGTDTGPGRLPEPEQIAELARAVGNGFEIPHDLSGKKFVISAGGTQEDLDPVRFIGNRSSGKQGYALAEVAAHRGAQVVLVSGSTEELQTPSGATIVNVQSAAEMAAAMYEHAQDADAVIMAAAVADYRPEHAAASKMKKGADDDSLNTLRLVENEDILKTLVAKRESGDIASDTVIMGFAAETGDEKTEAIEFARQKLAKKGCDFLMFNDVSGGQVFGRSRNRGVLLGEDGTEKAIEDGPKIDVAAQIIATVAASVNSAGKESSRRR